ncbi:MAG: cyclodeaminase/cyclohydrolase family protein, partial [Bacteroidota bacterium]|nr:cyclodeaminase/cyclohydrolase family protein [Bacteroidota bacterium]
FEVAQAMAEIGNPNSISDAGVGVLALNACVEGAWLNVKINSGELLSHPQVERMLREGEAVLQQADSRKREIVDTILQKLNA